jgi:hypothetical protein
MSAHATLAIEAPTGAGAERSSRTSWAVPKTAHRNAFHTNAFL